MSGGATAERSERWERSPPIVGGPGGAAGLVSQAAALGVRLEARQGGRLWADKPDVLPTALRDSLASCRPAVLRLLIEWQSVQATPPTAMPDARLPALALPGVPPLDWSRGVARLATRPAPPTIPPRRWAVLAATSARLLRDHGAELHAHGWDVLDVFGLHAVAPADHPSGWSLAWLLGAHGAVLDVSPAVVGMTREPDGARLAYRRTQVLARAGCLPVWDLPGVSA